MLWYIVNKKENVWYYLHWQLSCTNTNPHTSYLKEHFIVKSQLIFVIIIVIFNIIIILNLRIEQIQIASVLHTVKCVNFITNISGFFNNTSNGGGCKSMEIKTYWCKGICGSTGTSTACKIKFLYNLYSILNQQGKNLGVSCTQQIN